MMEFEIRYLQKKFPEAEIFESVDKDFICVRTVLFHGNLGQNSQGEKVVVPFYKIDKIHLSTVALAVMSENMEREDSNKKVKGWDNR